MSTLACLSEVMMSAFDDLPPAVPHKLRFVNDREEAAKWRDGAERGATFYLDGKCYKCVEIKIQFVPSWRAEFRFELTAQVVSI